MKFRVYRLNRVARWATLFLFLLINTSTFAIETKITKAETYRDIIEKAYNLSLQQDRQQALNILITALQKENRLVAVAEIRKAITDVSHAFLSNKAQQDFEAGLSFKKTDLNQAVSKLNEALRKEPDNLAIVSELARALIAKSDCVAANEVLQKQIKLLPYDEELKLGLAQSYVCQSMWAEYLKIFDLTEVRKSSLQKFWWLLEVEKAYKFKSLSKALDLLLNVKKIDPKYPAIFYWNWKLTLAQKHPNTEEAKKYLMSCKNISSNQARQYMMDPTFCRQIQEVEAELKGLNGNTE